MVEQEEIFRLRLDELRRGDAAIVAEHDSLDKRKLLHIRELKVRHSLFSARVE